jgi:TolB-like protein
VQVAQLRQALGRTPNGGEWIITAQRVGYRFVPSVDPSGSASRIPGVAILPFDDFGTAVTARARGFVEDLTSALSKFGSIRVIRRATNAGDRGRAFDVGAAYVVEGSVRRIAGRLRLNVHLLDGAAGTQLWAETVDIGTTAIDDALIGRIASLLVSQIELADTVRSRSERPNSESPSDLHRRARWLLRPSLERGNAEAYRLVMQALEMEPENIHFLATAAEILHHRGSVGWRPIGANDTEQMLDFVDRGMLLGIDDGTALGLFASALFTARDWDRGRATMERAIELNPNSSSTLTGAGLCFGWLGLTDLAETYYERAARNGPSDYSYRFAMNGLAVVNRRRGNHEAAVDFAQRALAIAPGHSGSHWNLITSTVMLGRKKDARRYADRFRSVSPTTSVASIEKGQPVADERLLTPVLESLVEAGMPEA